jgi:hypothetical protein
MKWLQLLPLPCMMKNMAAITMIILVLLPCLEVVIGMLIAMLVFRDPSYDTDSESFMDEGTSIYLPFQISLEANFMMLREDD